MADSLDSVGAPLRLLADLNQDVFRYGLYKYEDSQYEDPTYQGFTLEIVKESPLFTQVIPFLEQRGQNNTELQSRLVIYQEFVNRIVQIFNSQESAVSKNEQSIYIKSHYINSISGMSNLTHKFAKWKSDKLEIELYEDITLSTTYLANLYNNLVYSYENARQLIPENLLHFDLNIKISEIRSFTSIGKLASSDLNDQAIANALKNNVTCLIYTLHDCKFDWFGSQPIDDNITLAGIASNPPAPSVVGMQVYYKSVSRQTYNPLIKKAIAMNDARIDLGSVIVGYTGDLKQNGQAVDGAQGSLISGDVSNPYQKGQVTGTSNLNDISGIFSNASNKRPSSFRSYNRETTSNSEIDTSLDLSTEFDQLGELNAYNEQFAPDLNAGVAISGRPSDPGFESPNVNLRDILDDPSAAMKKYVDNQENRLGNSLNNLKNKGTSLVKQRLKQVKNELIRKRNELVREFVNDVVKNTGIKKIVPDNVYSETDFQQLLLDQLKSDVGINLSREALNFLTGAR